MNSNDNYTDVLLENIDGKFDRILEVVGAMQEKVNRIPAIETGVAEMKQDIKMLKHALTDTSKDLRDHERRITYLEAIAASQPTHSSAIQGTSEERPEAYVKYGEDAPELSDAVVCRMRRLCT